MSEIFPVIYLACHSKTAWSVTGRHTGAMKMTYPIRRCSFGMIPDRGQMNWTTIQKS